MRDKATVLSTPFPRVDDTMKGSAMIQDALKRPGPVPHLSDSELITLALSQERIGEPREDHVFRLHQAGLRPFFPGRKERSRDNRRTRDLWSVILAGRVRVQRVIDALLLEDMAARDVKANVQLTHELQDWDGAPLDEIRSRGYWDTRIRPATYQKDRVPLPELRQLLMQAAGHYRVWGFPYGTSQHPERGLTWIGLENQQEYSLQAWRFFQSGQLAAAQVFWMIGETGLATRIKAFHHPAKCYRHLASCIGLLRSNLYLC